MQDNALIADYKLEINYYQNGKTEQQMIRDLYSGETAVFNTFWYKFPYEYNTPWFGTKVSHLMEGINDKRIYIIRCGSVIKKDCNTPFYGKRNGSKYGIY